MCHTVNIKYIIFHLIQSFYNINIIITYEMGRQIEIGEMDY